MFSKITSLARLPTRATAGSAGYDLTTTEACSLPPHSITKLPTGLTINIPSNFFGKIESRSSLASKGIETTGGVIDSDYTGQVFVLLKNTTAATYEIPLHSRIAQLILLPYSTDGHEDAPARKRGAGGFGSTNVPSFTPFPDFLKEHLADYSGNNLTILEGQPCLGKSTFVRDKNCASLDYQEIIASVSDSTAQRHLFGKHLSIPKAAFYFSFLNRAFTQLISSLSPDAPHFYIDRSPLSDFVYNIMLRYLDVPHPDDAVNYFIQDWALLISEPLPIRSLKHHVIFYSSDYVTVTQRMQRRSTQLDQLLLGQCPNYPELNSRVWKHVAETLNIRSIDVKDGFIQL